MAIRVGIALDAFATLAADDGRPKTVEELAKPKGADPEFVGGCNLQEG